MTHSHLRSIVIVSMMMIFLIFSTAVRAADLHPSGLIIEAEFKPGIGHPVGRVRLVDGEVVISHNNEPVGYRAENNLPLFKGDTLMTLATGRIRIAFNDESILSMGPQSRLTIDESVYNPAQKSRLSFLTLGWGKIRCWVKKFIDMKQAEFNVRTATAVVGVRGSDFGILADRDSTRVVAFEKTMLSLLSRARPKLKPLLIKEFERVLIRLGERPSPVERLSPAQVMRLKQEFTFFPEIDPFGKKIIRKKRPGARAGPGSMMHQTDGVRILETELVEPDSIREALPLFRSDLMEITAYEDISRLEESIFDQQEDIHEQILEHDLIEQMVLEDLPSMPTTPES